MNSLVSLPFPVIALCDLVLQFTPSSGCSSDGEQQQQPSDLCLRVDGVLLLGACGGLHLRPCEVHEGTAAAPGTAGVAAAGVVTGGCMLTVGGRVRLQALRLPEEDSPYLQHLSTAHQLHRQLTADQLKQHPEWTRLQRWHAAHQVKGIHRTPTTH